MNTLLVTSTHESTGKTAITLALGKLAQERGNAVGYMKPKGTRLQSNVGKTLDEDPMLAREILGLDAEMHQMEPIVYSPTFVDGAIRGRENGDELGEIVEENFEQLAESKDLMLVEGGGVWSTGGIVDMTDVDVAERLDAGVLLVADYRKPSDLDDLLVAAEQFGDRLAGVLFNGVTDAVFDELEQEVVPFLEGRGVPVLGVVPREQELAGVTVADLADELGADVVTRGDEEEYVERFLVGAMGGDSALRYFRRTKDAAVITGGDRSEIITAALEAPGVKTIILTGGHRPSSAVLGKAEEKGVPVMLVNGDTLSVVDRAEDVVHTGRTRDEKTVSTMRDLLFEHADVDSLVGPEDGDSGADADGE
ncbi:protein with phosphotransacetylase biod-like n-terminal domain [Halogeometricum pallidum JCM 14848]|uniref:Protein with phosphotransacetylase biod-like n-terminal domain n=1 Tax=Halogeometricum pallidum JCM 14848 TaxID=1227487 RepID=M0CXM0_HALPD|nr:phosphotransacetylase family protein [Halogeometricum pallidum]ELZ26629.1 protein with phosphotransacetylase biod-like n-terminal domain [Halogeometricum pallidum JCM 14848]